MAPLPIGCQQGPSCECVNQKKPEKLPSPSALLPAERAGGSGGSTPFSFLLTSSSSSSYNEFYFLTHPALFIEDHFPDNKNWQLLKPPQSLRQFENNMYHKSEFYNKGMLSAHPETSMIRTGNSGQVARLGPQQQGQSHRLCAARSPPCRALARAHMGTWVCGHQAAKTIRQDMALGHIGKDRSPFTLA